MALTDKYWKVKNYVVLIKTLRWCCINDYFSLVFQVTVLNLPQDQWIVLVNSTCFYNSPEVSVCASFPREMKRGNEGVFLLLCLNFLEEEHTHKK